MKNLKTHTVGHVNFKYSLVSKGWEFATPTGHTMIRHCKGIEVATKVASVINGSLKRSGEIDNLARANITRMTVL